MPVVKEGTFGDIGVTLPATAPRAIHDDSGTGDVGLPNVVSALSLPELSFRVAAPTPQLATATDDWSVELNEMTLHKNFEGFIANLFHPNNEIYFTSIAWDYSGAAPVVYPPTGVDPSTYQFELKKDESKEFIGDGVTLWAPSRVVGALNLVILLYESDEDARRVGEVLTQVSDAVGQSKLSSLVVAISANPALATGVAVAEAVNELLGVVGKIMKNNQNDFVDQYEGSWSVAQAQKTQTVEYDQAATSIKLGFNVSAAAPPAPAPA